MTNLAKPVAKNSRTYTVHRRAALVYDGTGPRPVGSPAVTTVNLRLAMQRQPPTTTVRDFDGDESGGSARVWVTTDALAAVGWTELQIAPPEDTDGMSGDVIEWEGRRWEVVEHQGWDVFFTQAADFQRYKAADRGSV